MNNENRYHKITKKLYFFFALISFIYSSGEPSWFIRGGLPQYSVDYNYVGVGEGTTFSDAQSAAQAAIAAQLEVTVASTIEMQTTAVETENSSYFKDMFQQSTQSTISQTVKGVEIVKKAKAKGRYYVFAVLNKKRYVNSLKVELDQLWTKISSYVTDARRFSSEGRIFPSIENYMDVQEFIPNFYTKKAFYDAISSNPYIISNDITMGNVLTEMREILSGVNITIESGNRQSALIGGPLPNPIVFFIYLKKRGDKIPIPNLPIIIKYDDGSVVERVSTNSDGIIETYVTANPTSSKGGKVFARPNLVNLPSITRDYLKKAEASATYKIIDSPPISFTLRITDENDTRLDKVESKLTKNIEKMGYSVGEDSELLLDGKITIIDEKEVDGKSGRQYLVTAELDMFMVAKLNGEKVASFDAVGKGLSKKSIKDANKKAYKKLKISKKNLASMLSEADEELKRIFTKKSAEKLREGKALYDQGKLKKAIVPLTRVTHDEGQVEEAIKLIGKIKAQLNQIEKDRLARIEEEKRKKREHEMALANLAAETERARQQADLDIAAKYADAQVSSAQINADAQVSSAQINADAQVSSAQINADAQVSLANTKAGAQVLIAKLGVDEAELNARAAEAKATAEQSRVAIEKIKKETEKIRLDKLRSKESIKVAEAEKELAKTKPFYFITRVAEEWGILEKSKNPPSLSSTEKKLCGDWNYLGSINPQTEEENYDGAGEILAIKYEGTDRTYQNGSTSGSWTVKDNDFFISDYPMPFTVDESHLILTIDINGEQYNRIYERF